MQKVLVNPKTDDNVKSDAQIIIARAAIQTGDESENRSACAKLQAIAKGELAPKPCIMMPISKIKTENLKIRIL